MAQKRKIKLKHRVMRLLDLPEELLGMPRVTLVGSGQMLVENHRGIFEYGAESVRLKTRLGLMRISGSGLLLREIGADRLFVEGCIRKIEYE